MSTVAIVGAFMVSGISLWILSLVGGLVASAAYPALAVYRVEMFPTGNRSRAAGLVTAASLIGGVLGLLAMGALLDENWTFGSILAILAIGQLIVTVLVVAYYPETAHQELEAMNPEDVTRRTPCRRERGGSGRDAGDEVGRGRGDGRVGTLQVVAAPFDPHVLDRARGSSPSTR